MLVRTYIYALYVEWSVMYMHNLMYIHVSALEAAVLSLFMGWLWASLKPRYNHCENIESHMSLQILLTTDCHSFSCSHAVTNVVLVFILQIQFFCSINLFIRSSKSYYQFFVRCSVN